MIVSALRTPITRARKGGLKDTPADDLLATLLKATVDRTAWRLRVFGVWGMGFIVLDLGPNVQDLRFRV